MWVAGLDGGGSKTAIAIIDERLNVLGWGLAGPASTVFMPLPTARAHARQAWRQAIGRCPRPRQAIAAACYSHGNGQAMPRLPGIEWQPVGEPALVMGWALPGGTGVVLVAGTGVSACACRDGKAAAGASGGGFPLGDEGGAAWIGMEGVRAIFRADDGREQATVLSETISQALGLRRVRELVGIYHHERRLQRHQLAMLAPLVTAAAEAGDAVARRIVRAAAEELAVAVGAAARRAELAPPYRVIMIGGLMAAGPVVLTPVRRALRRLAPGARLRTSPLPNVFSVALAALRSTGRPAGLPEAKRLAANLRRLGLADWPSAEDCRAVNG